MTNDKKNGLHLVDLSEQKKTEESEWLCMLMDSLVQDIKSQVTEKREGPVPTVYNSQQVRTTLEDPEDCYEVQLSLKTRRNNIFPTVIDDYYRGVTPLSDVSKAVIHFANRLILQIEEDTHNVDLSSAGDEVDKEIESKYVMRGRFVDVKMNVSFAATDETVLSLTKKH
jgi:hypothetical protein